MIMPDWERDDLLGGHSPPDTSCEKARPRPRVLCRFPAACTYHKY
jgi:hypothetical protein